MTKAIKVATAKALKNLDYKLTEIAEVLGISERTAFTYVHETTNEKLQEFCNQFERLLLVTENDATAETLRAIRDKISDAEFKDLIIWYKTIRELRRPEGGGGNQVNIFQLIKEQKNRYGI